MWHKAIEKDLKDIFKMPKVLFEPAAFGKEQDVLFCQITSVRNTIQRGKAIARIDGRISIIGLLEKNVSGYMSKRIQLAPVEITEKFVFQREEIMQDVGMFEGFFNVYGIEFIYLYREQYNPQKKKISANNFVLKIINAIKGANNG